MRTMLLAMWQCALRLIMLVFVGLTFLGGTTVQALPPSSMAAMAEAGTPMPCCDDAADTGMPGPHRGITPDCVKVMQCLGIPALPVQAWLDSTFVSYAVVSYWSPDRRLSGQSPTPSPFPPKLA